MKTKKQYEQYLNEQYGFDSRWGWNRQAGAKTRPYGTWLRNADREMFNVHYKEWAAQIRLGGLALGVSHD